MVTFYDFPREHWRHIRTSNIVESPFFTEAMYRGRKTLQEGCQRHGLNMESSYGSGETLPEVKRFASALGSL